MTAEMRTTFSDELRTPPGQAIPLREFQIASRNLEPVAYRDTGLALQILLSLAEAFYQCFFGWGKFNFLYPHLAVAVNNGQIAGIGADWDSRERAISKALSGNPDLARGSAVAVNFSLVPSECAALLAVPHEKLALIGRPLWNIGSVCAPPFNEEAKRLLGAQGLSRFGQPLFSEHYFSWEMRLPAGMVASELLPAVQNLDAGKLLGRDLSAMIIAWTAVSYSDNALALANRGALIGLGRGSKNADFGILAKSAVNLAKKWDHLTEGSWFASIQPLPPGRKWKSWKVGLGAPEPLGTAACAGGILPDCA